MNTLPQPGWEPDFLQRSPLYAPLHAFAGELENSAGWPSLADLQGLLAAPGRRVVNLAGRAICLVPQGGKPDCMAEEYEPRIYLRGEVQTRSENWHDLFNALAWLAFPQAKAAINARHYAEILREREAAAGKERGKVRDRLTQFDESGVVILCADAVLADLLANHQWKQLFWENRAQLSRAMRFLVFGHSLYEKALRPYPGMTGKCLLLRVSAAELSKPLTQVVGLADTLLAAILADAARFNADTRLQPVPLLGIPGWAAGNARAEYYDDVRYFRPKRWKANGK